MRDACIEIEHPDEPGRYVAIGHVLDLRWTVTGPTTELFENSSWGPGGRSVAPTLVVEGPARGDAEVEIEYDPDDPSHDLMTRVSADIRTIRWNVIEGDVGMTFRGIIDRFAVRAESSPNSRPPKVVMIATIGLTGDVMPVDPGLRDAIRIAMAGSDTRPNEMIPEDYHA